jgi:hypothetical protein
MSRAAWSPCAASRLLLTRLVRAFALTGPLVVGIDETLERRGANAQSREAGAPTSDFSLNADRLSL